MRSGEVYPSAHTTVRQIDDGERIELPLEDEPVQAERPPGLGPEGKKGRGSGKGGKKEAPQKWKNLALKSKKREERPPYQYT